VASSLYPYPVVDRITIPDAAATTGALWIILLGVGLTLPAIIAYSVYSYWVFRGRATALKYE
jgi:cytochrome bd ubiquinol oxidase subunit II